jgi:hypothetical protein
MDSPGRKLSHRELISCAALYGPLLACSLTTACAAAQDYGHMRVIHGSAWTETSPQTPLQPAPLPPGPAHAGYGFAHEAGSTALNDRVRLKAPGFNGM